MVKSLLALAAAALALGGTCEAPINQDLQNLARYESELTDLQQRVSSAYDGRLEKGFRLLMTGGQDDDMVRLHNETPGLAQSVLDEAIIAGRNYYVTQKKLDEYESELGDRLRQVSLAHDGRLYEAIGQLMTYGESDDLIRLHNEETPGPAQNVLQEAIVAGMKYYETQKSRYESELTDLLQRVSLAYDGRLAEGIGLLLRGGQDDDMVRLRNETPGLAQSVLDEAIVAGRKYYVKRKKLAEYKSELDDRLRQVSSAHDGRLKEAIRQVMTDGKSDDLIRLHSEETPGPAQNVLRQALVAGVNYYETQKKIQEERLTGLRRFFSEKLFGNTQKKLQG